MLFQPVPLYLRTLHSQHIIVISENYKQERGENWVSPLPRDCLPYSFEGHVGFSSFCSWFYFVYYHHRADEMGKEH